MPDVLRDILISVSFSLGPFLALLLVGFLFGTAAHNRHIRDLDAREAALGPMLLTNTGHVSGDRGELVIGSTVVAYDYFRRVAVVLRKLLGGRFRMHERFMERARREAVLRMAETARERGASAVHNIRLVSSNLGNSSSAMSGCEVLAYGTAVWNEAQS